MASTILSLQLKLSFNSQQKILTASHKCRYFYMALFYPQRHESRDYHKNMGRQKLYMLLKIREFRINAYKITFISYDVLNNDVMNSIRL